MPATLRLANAPSRAIPTLPRLRCLSACGSTPCRSSRNHPALASPAVPRPSVPVPPIRPPPRLPAPPWRSARCRSSSRRPSEPTLPAAPLQSPCFPVSSSAPCLRLRLPGLAISAVPPRHVRPAMLFSLGRLLIHLPRTLKPGQIIGIGASTLLGQPIHKRLMQRQHFRYPHLHELRHVIAHRADMIPRFVRQFIGALPALAVQHRIGFPLLLTRVFPDQHGSCILVK